MSGLKKPLILLLFCACGLTSKGQQRLTFQVLVSEYASAGGEAIAQFDNLLPGDSVVVEESGYLALISNYYHALEISNDTVFVLPRFGVEALGAEYERPDLRSLFANQGFNWSKSKESVEHASYLMDLLFPTSTHTISSVGSVSIPVVWNDNRRDEERRGRITVKIKNIFDDDVAVFQVEGDSICLALNRYPEVLGVLQKDSVAIVSFEQPRLNGRDFAIKLTNTQAWQAPFASCEIDSAPAAVALAMFLEFNRPYFKDTKTSYYYQLASQFSAKPQYLKIFEHYKSRRAGK